MATGVAKVGFYSYQCPTNLPCSFTTLHGGMLNYVTLVSCINACPTLLSPSTCSPRFLCNSLLVPRASKLFFSLRKMKGGALEIGEGSKTSIPRGGVNRGISILDFILRLLAIIGTLGSAIAMGTTDETLPFVTQFIQFRAEYDDLPTLTFFVIANSIVSGYLVLSLPMSIFHILRSGARASRIVLIFFDTAMLALLTAAASAASAIVYLAHKGNTQANWFAICQQFNSFCERISGSLIGSFGGIIVFILLVLLSAVALSRC